MRLPNGSLRLFSLLTLTAAMLAGCSQTPAFPTSPSALVDAAAVVKPAALLVAPRGVTAPNINGLWNARGVVQLTVPPWVAQLVLGIVPEGPVTHIRCESSGTMELTQLGESFSGIQYRDPNVCETRGGQRYEEPKGMVPVLEGRIEGRSLGFELEDPPLTCPQRGVITQIEDGTATRLSGTARCIVPGHPQSDAPPPFDIDPPPGGTSKTLTWEAWR